MKQKEMNAENRACVQAQFIAFNSRHSFLEDQTLRYSTSIKQHSAKNLTEIHFYTCTEGHASPMSLCSSSESRQHNDVRSLAAGGRVCMIV